MLCYDRRTSAMHQAQSQKLEVKISASGMLRARVGESPRSREENARHGHATSRGKLNLNRATARPTTSSQTAKHNPLFFVTSLLCSD